MLVEWGECFSEFDGHVFVQGLCVFAGVFFDLFDEFFFGLSGVEDLASDAVVFLCGYVFDFDLGCAAYGARALCEEVLEQERGRGKRGARAVLYVVEFWGWWGQLAALGILCVFCVSGCVVNTVDCVLAVELLHFELRVSDGGVANVHDHVGDAGERVVEGWVSYVGCSEVVLVLREEGCDFVFFVFAWGGLVVEDDCFVCC